MAIIDFLFQGQEPTRNHIDDFKNIVETTDDIEKIIISAAFVRSEGIKLLDEVLNPYYEKTVVYLGIRNGITSIQGLFNLLHRKIKVYAVDTATPAILYHPKIYGVLGSQNASLIIGSANLTAGGLYRNIEASLKISLNRDDEEDIAVWSQYEDSLRFLREECSENVILVENKYEAFGLFKDGLLSDERVRSKPQIHGTKTTSRASERPSIKTKPKKVSTSATKIKRKKRREIQRELNSNEWVLLWESNPLTERDLNIPTGKNTNPTGSMLFKKGAVEGIDQRHYFRDDIFNELPWETDAERPHMERVFADFLIVIKEVNYGKFHLKLSHNTDTESASYKQKNSMTSIHWAESKDVIAKRALLDCTLKLYKPENNENYFILTID